MQKPEPKNKNNRSHANLAANMEVLLTSILA